MGAPHFPQNFFPVPGPISHPQFSQNGIGEVLQFSGIRFFHHPGAEKKKNEKNGGKRPGQVARKDPYSFLRAWTSFATVSCASPYSIRVLSR